jgi:hypothetical protein
LHDCAEHCRTGIHAVLTAPTIIISLANTTQLPSKTGRLLASGERGISDTSVAFDQVQTFALHYIAAADQDDLAGNATMRTSQQLHVAATLFEVAESIKHKEPAYANKAAKMKEHARARAVTIADALNNGRAVPPVQPAPAIVRKISEGSCKVCIHLPHLHHCNMMAEEVHPSHSHRLQAAVVAAYLQACMTLDQSLHRWHRQQRVEPSALRWWRQSQCRSPPPPLQQQHRTRRLGR